MQHSPEFPCFKKRENLGGDREFLPRKGKLIFLSRFSQSYVPKKEICFTRVLFLLQTTNKQSQMSSKRRRELDPVSLRFQTQKTTNSQQKKRKISKPKEASSSNATAFSQNFSDSDSENDSFTSENSNNVVEHNQVLMQQNSTLSSPHSARIPFKTSKQGQVDRLNGLFFLDLIKSNRRIFSGNTNL